MDFLFGKKKGAKKPLGIVICGGPGSGKGTQCEYIKEKFGVVHLSTGDMLRAAVKSGSDIGKEAEKVMATGGLVSDELMIKVIGERLDQDDIKTSGFLLDGFPRTPAQAEALKDMVPIDIVLFLEVPDEVLTGRMTGRRLDPETGAIYHLVTKPPPADIMERLVHRADDNEETAKTRISTYNDNASYIKSTFKDETLEVNGNQKPTLVWKSISAALRKKQKAKK